MALPIGNADMKDSFLDTAGLDINRLSPLQREGLDWIWLLTSGGATEADVAAMEQWKAQSLAHAEALANAVKLRRLVSSQTVFDYSKPHFWDRPTVTRRMAIGGLVTAVVGYGALRPPMSMWPSVAELTSDYRTGTGEQQQVAFRSGVAVQLNTRTNVSMTSSDGQPGLTLVSGQIGLTADLPKDREFTVFAGEGRIVATKANLDVFKDERSTRVTCLNGEAKVTAFGREARLSPRHSLEISSTGIGNPTPVDVELASAWRQGRLLFHNASFETIVSDINRYRPGRIVIVNNALAHRQFNADFDVKNIGRVVSDLQSLSHAQVTQLPGGLVLLA